MIGNPDAHAKNYSILYQDSVCLAPIYDVNNAVAFAKHFKQQRPIMAQSIGGEFDSTKIEKSHWVRFAEESNMSSQFVCAKLEKMSTDIIKESNKLREELRGTISDSNLLDIVVMDIQQRAEKVSRYLDIPKSKSLRF